MSFKKNWWPSGLGQSSLWRTLGVQTWGICTLFWSRVLNKGLGSRYGWKLEQRTAVFIIEGYFIPLFILSFDFLENQGYIRASSLCFLRIMGICVCVCVCVSQSLFFWFFKPWLYIRTSSSDYLRGLGTHHPNQSYWYLRTMDTKIKQLPSEARNTCWWYVAVCVHKIWNLSTKEGSLFVLFFWDLPKHSAFYNLVLGFCLFIRHAMSQYVAPIVLSDLEIFMTLFFSFLKVFHAACW